MSVDEIQILNFIKEHYNGIIIENDRKTITPYELDIYLPELNIAFEYNGLYWHSEIYKDKNYHKNKTELSLKKNIELIQIYEDDWKYKKEIVKSFILSKLNIFKKEIDGSCCEIKEINNKITKGFLTENHLKGYIKSSIKVGMFNDDELLSVLIFNNQNDVATHCNILNTNIINGDLKIFNYFINKYKPSKIVICEDNSYPNINKYLKLGFSMVKYKKPNKYYILNGRRIIRKNENFNKIYDSGNYEMILKLF